MNAKLVKIKELVEKLNKASEAYYKYDKPIMTDKQYDDLYDELGLLEQETGIVMANSPTQKVQGVVLEGFKKVTHSKPMLSANKTKDINEITEFIGNRSVMASYKLDGLTLVTRYKDGKLVQAITRGSGTDGEDVTEQAKMITNLPLFIPCNFELELRGECVVSWDNFNKINESLEEPYSHPRNLAAGSLRTLDTNITRERKLEYIVFELVSYDRDNTYRAFNYRNQSLNWLTTLGFDTVHRISIPAPDCSSSPCFEGSIICENIDYVVEEMTAENSEYPVDGLIFNYENLSYAAYLGSTSHHPLDMIALKWANETFETELLDIEWNTTRTGRINPTAIFKPVMIEGSSVSRATVHNVSIMEELKLGKGDAITVYKSNQIIPAIDENLTMSGTFTPPKHCPCCGAKTELRNEKGSKTLHCPNENCKARLIAKLTHFVSRDCMNIDGLSEATLEKLISMGWVNSFADIYKLHQYRSEMQMLEGFGSKSVAKLLLSIQNSRNTDLVHFLNALGIPGCGKSTSKDIATYCKDNLDTFLLHMDTSRAREFLNINGIGKTLVDSMYQWYRDVGFDVIFELVDNYIIIETNDSAESYDIITADLSGKTYVITGSLNLFKSRDGLKELIESLGGKVSGSVSAKTTALINNDINSNSSKNKKAKDLGVNIITEGEFLDSIGY